MEFYIPTETGERLAFCAAALTSLLGAIMMFAPGLSMRFLGVQPAPGRRGISEIRSTIGGFYLGFGLTALLLMETRLYLALSAAFLLSFFGRIISMLSDGGANRAANLALLVLQAALAALPLPYVFGLL